MSTKGEPEHTKRVRETVVTFKNGEPSEIEAFVEYKIYVPERGPEFEATEELGERYDETEREHVIDGLYDLVYQDGGGDWEDVRDELQEGGFVTVDARGGVGRAKVYEDDVEWEIVDQEGTFTGGMNARWTFDVEGGFAEASEVEKVEIGFASEEAMPIEVLRTLPVANQAALSIPGIDDVTPSGELATRLVLQGAEADWG